MHKLLVLVLLSIVWQCINGNSHSMGSCPDIDPVPRFAINKFLGTWYVIQRTSTSTACLMYNITENSEKPGHYEITEIKPHAPFWATALYHEDITTGDLTIPDPTVPGRMSLNLPYDIIRTNFTVFSTDYDTHAAIFTCKKWPLVHKWSAAILSRSRKLDMQYVDVVRTRLSSYNVDPFTFSIIKQAGCPEPGSEGSIIKSATKVVHKIEDAIDDLTKDLK